MPEDAPRIVVVPLPHAYLAKAAREAASAQVKEWMRPVMERSDLLPLSIDQEVVVHSTAAYTAMVVAIWVSQAILENPELAQVFAVMTAEEMQYALIADTHRHERQAKEEEAKRKT